MAFHDDLKIKMHQYVKLVYKVSKSFQKDELYGLTSQYRRAGMSVILNYLEGYARRRGENSKVYLNFFKYILRLVKRVQIHHLFCFH